MSSKPINYPIVLMFARLFVIMCAKVLLENLVVLKTQTFGPHLLEGVNDQFSSAFAFYGSNSSIFTSIEY